MHLPRKLQRKLTDANAASHIIRDGMTVATSGFSKVGYPKAVCRELAKNRNQGPTGITLITSGATGDEVDQWVAQGGVRRLLPYQSSKILRGLINEGRLSYADHHLGHVAQWVEYGHWGRPDVALVEIRGVDSDGQLIPGLTIGNIPPYLESADQIILEINVGGADLYGFHDVMGLGLSSDPIPVRCVTDRVGTMAIPVDFDKVSAVVMAEGRDSGYRFSEPTPIMVGIAKNVSRVLKSAVAGQEIPQGFSIQVGVGNLGNAILHQLSLDLAPLRIHSEVVQDSVLAGLDNGSIAAVSTGTLALSHAGQDHMACNSDRYRSAVVIRPLYIANHPEIIRRLNVVSVNSVVEVDLYGHANASAVMGSRVLNGVGGSGDFVRNAFLSVVAMPSMRDGGRISTIVPMVSHVDHTEHDVHMVVTENGVADLRGKSPRERARLMIQHCASERFKGPLQAYFDRACRRSGQWPHLLSEALSWHVAYEETGDMLP